MLSSREGGVKPNLVSCGGGAVLFVTVQMSVAGWLITMLALSTLASTFNCTSKMV